MIKHAATVRVCSDQQSSDVLRYEESHDRQSTIVFISFMSLMLDDPPMVAL
jgi:hypothetical protein